MRPSGGNCPLVRRSGASRLCASAAGRAAHPLATGSGGGYRAARSWFQALEAATSCDRFTWPRFYFDGGVSLPGVLDLGATLKGNRLSPAAALRYCVEPYGGAPSERAESI